MSYEIPICPECGKIAETFDDGKIFCSDCLQIWWNKSMKRLGKEGVAQLIYDLEQDSKLGINLDKKPDK